MPEKIILFEVAVPESKLEIFLWMMKGEAITGQALCLKCPLCQGNFVHRDTGFFRVADLDAWHTGKQKTVEEG